MLTDARTSIRAQSGSAPRGAAIATAASLAALAVLTVAASPAAGKGLDTMGAVGGLAPPGSPYRYQTLTPRHPRLEGRRTIVERIDRRGGLVSRWWRLRGSWIIPAAAYDGSGTGLSANGQRLVLQAYRYAYPRPGRWTTRFAVLYTGPHPRQRPGTDSVPLSRKPVYRITLRGDYRLAAVSPSGATAYVYRYLRPGSPAPYELLALNTSTKRLSPQPLFDSRRQRRRLEGLPVTGLEAGRWSYTLFFGGGARFYLQGLDTASGRVITVDLSQLGQMRQPMGLRLALTDGGRRLAVRGRSSGLGRPEELATIDRADLRVRATAATRAAARPFGFLFTPRHPGNLVERLGVAGHSLRGRPIRVQQWGDPARPAVLAFGCIHGDECAARSLEPRFVLSSGCPDPVADLVLVHNLDPDGFRAGTRLNADGVDLNRNFPAGWRPIGGPGDPQHSGPRPFSEPESRLAARLIEAVRPRVTIWFHQHDGPRPLVRGWGQSAPAGRRFAHLAGIPFHLLPWLDGTAPNWQNHRFAGTASFVVELPPGRLERRLERRLGAALARLAHRVGEDGYVATG